MTNFQFQVSLSDYFYQYLRDAVESKDLETIAAVNSIVSQTTVYTGSLVQLFDP